MVSSVIQNFEWKQLKKGGTWMEEVNTKEINWYPIQKVTFARRKLQGANPAAITRYCTVLKHMGKSWEGFQTLLLFSHLLINV